MILRGNHKPPHSEMNSAALNKSNSKEVNHGWALPLTIGSLHKIKNAGVVPLGVAEQLSINKNGKRYIKQCVTRDCSFPGSSGLYLNNRFQQESLQPCIYGLCLFRILHIISAMRNKWPTKLIFIGKTDPDAAYRRIHANATTA